MTRSTSLLASLVACATLGLASTHATAQQSSRLLVQIEGPGGHSSIDYGRTSAVHAAARSLVQLRGSTIDRSAYTVSALRGGNSVNSIARDASYEVRLTAADAAALQRMVEQLTAAVRAGVEAENAFRGVKAGDMAAGVPATVSFRITPQ